MIKSKKGCLLFLVLMPTFVFSQDLVKAKEKNTVIERIKEQVDSNYVFVEKVEYINNSLDSLSKTKKYKSLKEHKAFADALTEDLVAITKDKHFKVQYNPALIKSRREWRERMRQEQEDQGNDEEEAIDWNYWYAQKENFGLAKIEILDGNIGYIKSTFWQPLDWVKPTFDATMAFVAHTDALIIDLRENQGGYSPSDSYLGSYFFKADSTLWNSSYNRPTGETTPQYTFKEVGGTRYLDKPVFILIGEETFSLAEKFAYSMKHFNKATIIGQTSAGAAHSIDFIELNDNYAIQIPISYNIHPVTKTDWEGTGVIPDVKTAKEETLKVAYLNALEKLIERAKKDDYKTLLKRYDKIKAEINNR
ncbi:MAG: S41 family peptidase [Thermonemataceae bacterium]